jgi:hypothetical protein
LSLERALKITRVLCSEEVEELKPFFITLTFQSQQSSALSYEESKAQLEKFNSVWRRSKKSKDFLPGLSLAVVEVTSGKQMNLHVHAHILGFYDESVTPERTVGRWLLSASKEGVVATRSSQCIKEVSLEDRGRLARYLAKGSTVAGMAMELQGAHWKSGTIADLLDSKKGSIKDRAYRAIVPALTEKSFRTWRPSRRFGQLVTRLEAEALEKEGKEEEVSSEADASLSIPAKVWKEANRLELPASLRGEWRFTIRDLLEDLLLDGDVILAEGVIEIVEKHVHYRRKLSNEEYERRLWLKLEALLL